MAIFQINIIVCHSLNTITKWSSNNICNFHQKLQLNRILRHVVLQEIASQRLSRNFARYRYELMLSRPPSESLTYLQIFRRLSFSKSNMFLVERAEANGGRVSRRFLSQMLQNLVRLLGHFRSKGAGTPPSGSIWWTEPSGDLLTNRHLGRRSCLTISTNSNRGAP